MPAGAGKPLQHRPLGGLLVEMHRLRVEFGGKGQNLLARDAAGSEPAEMAGREIFECQRGHDGEMSVRKPDCGRYLRQSQPGDLHGLRATGEHHPPVPVQGLVRDDFQG